MMDSDYPVESPRRTNAQKPFLQTSEKPFLLLVTGYPENEAMVPDIDCLALDDIMNIV